MGEVTKVSVLPSSQNRWLNPELKVYDVTIAIKAVYEWLKPGMTAEVRIHIDNLKDVLFVPIQAVSNRGDDRVCYLSNRDHKKVETGQFNDMHIEILNGLEEGETIMLYPLDDLEETETDPKETETEEDTMLAEPDTPTEISAEKENTGSTDKTKDKTDDGQA